MIKPFLLLFIIISGAAVGAQTEEYISATHATGDIALLQWLLNAAFGLLGLIGGWGIKFLHQAMRDLQEADAELAEKVHNIQILVAGEYVKRNELERLSEALFDKLDRIENKLDKKQDK